MTEDYGKSMIEAGIANAAHQWASAFDAASCTADVLGTIATGIAETHDHLREAWASGNSDELDRIIFVALTYMTSLTRGILSHIAGTADDS